MLELRDVTFQPSGSSLDRPLLSEINLRIPRRHFMAIVGPSGCGKTTLLKTIAGIIPESSGSLHWDGRNLAQEGDFSPWEIGYVPQFSIAFDNLTVDESLESTARLRVRCRSKPTFNKLLDNILHQTGLHELADRPVHVLSGGQKRRLGLAMELVTTPSLLLCDEVTSGLDPRSEKEILHLLHEISRRDDRLVISVTHSLAHLELYDSVLVLHQGHVAYHGPPENACHYFSTTHEEDIYPALAHKEAPEWHASWQKHHSAYESQILATTPEPEEQPTSDGAKDPSDSSPTSPPNDHRLPSLLTQMHAILRRRWTTFLRDRTQVILQLCILLCFPGLVALFAERGQQPLKKLTESRSENILTELHQQSTVRQNHIQVGSAVSGLIMFQVVLLALMGANNAAREVAAERHVYEKERFGGLRPLAYLLGKLLYLSTFVLIQSAWMACFVQWFWEFPGNFTHHLSFLFLINASITAVCLGISSLMKTAEQASLLSIYLVGFQLPLSGAILALPERFESLTRPLIAAYWAWSGSVDSLQDGVYNAVRLITGTSLSATNLCLYVLVAHTMLGILITWLGLHQNHQK